MTKSVLLRLCGYGDYSKSVTANLGETKTIDATLAAGIHEDFSAPASSCWKPGIASKWSTSGGIYRYDGKVKYWDYNFYNHAFSGSFTVTAKLRRFSGMRYNSNGLFLADSKNMTSSCSAYVFQYTADGWWSIWLLKKGNMNAGAPWAGISPWKTSTAIKQGLNVWNVLKIVKAGGNYTFFINDVPITSFTGSADMQYAGMTNYHENYNIIIDYDYFYLSSGATAGSIPGLPSTPFTPPAASSNGRADF